MKSNRLFLAFVLCGLGIGAAKAQEFSVDWFSIDGGGGSSTGGVYAVSGTIGQSDTAAMSGGDYTLQGGFWSIVALEAGTIPVLHITTAPGGVAISWSGPALDFVLQESPRLGPSANWTDVGAPVIVNGPENTVIQPIASGGRFYRLRHP